MTVLTGTLKDAGLALLTGKAPVLVWRLSQMTQVGALVLVPRPVECTPAANGSWSVTLADTDSMPAGAHYRLSARWVEGDQTFYAEYPHNIPMPAGTWDFGSLPSVPLAPNNVWVGGSPPADTTRWWLDNTTGLLKRWS